MAYAKKYLKLIISLGMIALVSFKVDLHHVAEMLEHVPIKIFLVGIVGYLLSLVVSSLRWWRLARAAGVHCNFRRVLSASLIGAYANAFGLGTIGGDLLRAALLCSTEAHKGAALASVAADRMLGLGVLASIGVVSAAMVALPENALIYVPVAGAVIVGGIGLWFSIPWFLTRFERFEWFKRILGDAGHAFPRSPRVLGEVVAIATLFHLIQIGVFGLIVSMMGVKIPWSYLLAALPIANIIATLPLSWMGLGVRDGLYVMLFSPVYMTSETAILCAALWLISMMGASVVGGVMAVLTGELAVVRGKGGGVREPLGTKGGSPQ